MFIFKVKIPVNSQVLNRNPQTLIYCLEPARISTSSHNYNSITIILNSLPQTQLQANYTRMRHCWNGSQKEKKKLYPQCFPYKILKLNETKCTHTHTRTPFWERTGCYKRNPEKAGQQLPHLTAQWSWGGGGGAEETWAAQWLPGSDCGEESLRLSKLRQPGFGDAAPTGPGAHPGCLRPASPWISLFLLFPLPFCFSGFLSTLAEASPSSAPRLFVLPTRPWPEACRPPATPGLPALPLNPQLPHVPSSSSSRAPAYPAP